MSCQHTQFEAEMAVNGYLSTFVHINHIVSTHRFWSSCVYFLFFFYQLQHHQFCGWHVCLADGCSPLSLGFCVSLRLASLSCCQCTSNVRASLQLCPRSPLMKLTILTDTRWDCKPQKEKESVTCADWQTVQFWHSTHRPLKPCLAVCGSFKLNEI